MTVTKATLAANLNDHSGIITTYIKPGVVVHVRNAEDGKAPAPAWYIPGTDDIYIDVDRALVPEALHDEWYSLDDKVRARLLGLLAHEAAHSRWSHWLDPRKVKTTRAVFAVLTMLEEIRIENRAVAAAPHVATHLRAALPLVIGDLKDKAITSRAAAARGWALIYGRTLSGIVHDDDVDWMDETARIVLGDDDVDALVELLTEAVGRLIEIAEEWIEVVGVDEPDDDDGDGEGGGGCSHGDPPEDGDESDEAEAEDGEGEGGSGDEAEDGDESDESSGGGKSDESDDESNDEAEAEDGEGEGDDDEADDGDEGTREGNDPGGMGDVGSQDGPTDSGSESQPLDPEAAEAMWEAIKDAIGDVDENWKPDRTGLDLSDPAKLAAEVFGRKPRKGRLFPQEPTVIERGEIAKTARILESLSLPSITKVPVASLVPPGRLRSREAVRQVAERSTGGVSTAKPWRATKRRHDSVKPVVLGVMTDVSGSMAWAEQVVAQVAYVWGNAGHRVGARTAAVTFGDKVDAIIRPGEVPAKVQVKSADGGSEAFDEAAAALDGVLKLSAQNGAAKVLIIVSDGHLVRVREVDRAYEWCKRFKEAGTKIVWVRPNRGSHALTDRLEKDGLATVVGLDGVGWYASPDDHSVFGKVQAAALSAIARR
jgi:hypothetical protein